MIFSDEVSDRFIAPEMSKFTSASITDMSHTDPEQEFWLANFILNNIFDARVPTPLWQIHFNFLRRCDSAFESYATARGLTLNFLEDREKQMRYLRAISHWETFLAHLWQAAWFLAYGKPLLFKRDDGSALQRLNFLHGVTKHADSAIRDGNFKDDGPLCMWLTNSGLRSGDTTLTFIEMSGILGELAQFASALQHPQTALASLKRLRDTRSDANGEGGPTCVRGRGRMSHGRPLYPGVTG